MELLLFSGIQAAGKSTFFKDRCADTHIRINLDMLRTRRREALLDSPIPSGFQIVARLDGRGFTRLTKDLCRFEAPFDSRFRDLMAATCRHLMTCGFSTC